MMLGLSITATYALWLAAAAIGVFVLVAVLPWAALRRRPHRSWFQRTLIAGNVVLVLAALGAAYGLTYFQEQLGSVRRVDPGEDVLTESTDPGDPQNYLLVGVDRAAGLDPDDPVNIGRDPESHLADTVMVLRVIPDSGQAHLLSLPRDLWLPIAGTSRRDRINATLNVDGPATLIATIEENFGIPIHHYMEVDFVGFKELVGVLGGVPMFFPESVRDPNTGLLITVGDGGECVDLDPEMALAFVRSRRQYQVLADGRWTTDPTADLGRIERQQLFMQLAVHQAIDQGARNPIRLNQIIGAGVGSVTLDNTVTNRELLDVGAQFTDFDPDSLHTYTLPVEPGEVGGASVVFLIESEAQDELNVFRGVSNDIPTFEGVRVSVRNGSGAGGQGTEVSRGLSGLGFTVVSTANADRFDHEQTLVRHGPDDLLPAVFLARFIENDVVFEEVTAVGAASVELITGDDFAGLRAEARPLDDFDDVLASVTSTTVAPTTTVPTTAGPAQPVSPPTTIGFVPEQRKSC